MGHVTLRPSDSAARRGLAHLHLRVQRDHIAWRHYRSLLSLPSPVCRHVVGHSAAFVRRQILSPLHRVVVGGVSVLVVFAHI